jgi:peptidoglycan/xylan/chitin deacetylase (PgdA/CDA1 family)
MTSSAIEGTAKRRVLSKMPLVLMYHSIAPYDEDPYEVTMTPQRFEAQMRWLTARRLRGVSMGELLCAARQGRARGLVGLTFDDGYQDFDEHAIPILRRFGFTATAFVLAGRLGGENEWSRPGPSKPLLSADEVRHVAQLGIEIGSHGLKHIRLPETDESALIAEIEQSRAILGDLVGQQISGFCYPYGELDARVVQAVRTAGYDYACAVRRSAAIGRYAIPRTYVHDRDTTWRLDAKRIVSGLRVGNRIAVEHYRGGA